MFIIETVFILNFLRSFKEDINYKETVEFLKSLQTDKMVLELRNSSRGKRSSS